MSSSPYRRIHVPIHCLSNNSSKNTTVQWINDPISGNEIYRMKINIEGFQQNEVNIRVDGSRLFIYGEHIENKSQGTSKKIIEKYYDLPPDIDTFRPHVTFPSSITMQVDFLTQSSRSIHYENQRIPIINSRNSVIFPDKP